MMHFNRLIRFLLLGVMMLSIATVSSPAAASTGVFVSVNFGPPALPVYVQPLAPGPGFIWAPGYWAWSPNYGSYWVPGTWVLAPESGLLWTPGYWAFNDGLYDWYPGYWGPVVGYYGGIDYGFGYTGVGYYGGYWRGDTFYYNRAVSNVSVTTVHNVYSTTVANRATTTSRASFNGPGGVTARATAEQQAASRQRRMEATSAQVQQEKAASANTQLRASVNHGRPSIAATQKPAQFKGRGVVAAERAGGAYKAPKMSPQEATQTGKAAPGREARPEKQAATSRKQAQPERQARPVKQVQPQRQARPEKHAAPQRQAQPERQARPEMQAPPQRPTRSQRQAVPERQHPPERAARPVRQALPERQPPPSRVRPEYRTPPAAPPREYRTPPAAPVRMTVPRPENEPRRGAEPPRTNSAPERRPHPGRP